MKFALEEYWTYLRRIEVDEKDKETVQRKYEAGLYKDKLEEQGQEPLDDFYYEISSEEGD